MCLGMKDRGEDAGDGVEVELAERDERCEQPETTRRQTISVFFPTDRTHFAHVSAVCPSLRLSKPSLARQTVSSATAPARSTRWRSISRGEIGRAHV